MMLFSLFIVVILGSSIGFFISGKGARHQLMLSFSGAFVLAITLTEILPEEVYNSGNLKIGFWVLLGVAIQIFLELFTKGLEHGHIHTNISGTQFFLLYAGLLLHAFLEGLPGEIAGKSYLLSILIHKFPIALVFGTLLSSSKLKGLTSFLLIVTFALASPLAYKISDFLPESISRIAIGIAGGIFLHISTTIIFESSDKHQLQWKYALSIFFGFAMGMLSLLI